MPSKTYTPRLPGPPLADRWPGALAAGVVPGPARCAGKAEQVAKREGKSVSQLAREAFEEHVLH